MRVEAGSEWGPTAHFRWKVLTVVRKDRRVGGGILTERMGRELEQKWTRISVSKSKWTVEEEWRQLPVVEDKMDIRGTE
jgi:hypothetical protein